MTEILRLYEEKISGILEINTFRIKSWNPYVIQVLRLIGKEFS